MMKKKTVKEILNCYMDKMSLEYSGDCGISKRKILEIIVYVTGKSNFFNLFKLEVEHKDFLKIEKILDAVLVKKKPVQYAIGTVDFLDCEIIVAPPIFIPRPETEYMCSLIVDFLNKNKFKSFRLLDLCTGTGCIGISILKCFPDAVGLAVDVDVNAICLAEKNIKKHDLSFRLKLVQSDLYESVELGERFDLIVSNPPYIPKSARLDCSVISWEDEKALFAGRDGLDCIKNIVFQMPNYISDKGIAVLECDSSNVGDTESLMARVFGKNNVRIINDQYNIPRFVIMSRVRFF
jgi:release factor glutamine methyltransferase